jgi:Holliday junction resolvasome RuvABC endonuclease subunit
MASQQKPGKTNGQKCLKFKKMPKSDDAADALAAAVCCANA